MVTHIAESGQIINSSYTDKNIYPAVNFTIRLDKEMVKGKTILA